MPLLKRRIIKKYIFSTKLNVDAHQSRILGQCFKVKNKTKNPYLVSPRIGGNF